MARPRKEGLEYFPHDVYASSDEKIEPLLLLYGSKGYGFYFLHLEYIYRNSDLEFDISDAETREVIKQKLHISSEEYEQILQTALKKKCFDNEYYNSTGKLTSTGVKKRASIVLEKREKMRVAYENKISGIVSDAETTHIKKSKEKKSKEKKSIHNNIADLIENYTSNSDLKKSLQDYTEMRKQIKSPFTENAFKLMLKKLNSMAASDETKIKILEQSIMNGWKGIFELKETDKPKPKELGNKYYKQGKTIDMSKYYDIGG